MFRYFTISLTILSLFLSLNFCSKSKKDDSKVMLALVGLSVMQGLTCSSEDMQVVSRSSASTGSYPLIDTSQTGLWDNSGTTISAPAAGQDYYGQDSQFSGTQASYTMSSDGLTIKDNITGLTWQKNYESSTYFWADTQSVITSLNNKNYGGYNDWRAPTIKELYSLWNAGSGWPYISTNYFTINYTSEMELSRTIFWSSDKYSGLMGNITDNSPGSSLGAKLAFGVNFGTGHIKAYSICRGPKHSIRAVRGNLSYGVNLFQNNGDGTISDLSTGLMWSQIDSNTGMDWKSALAYAETKNNANYQGYSDWRLPNTKELQGIVDYKRSPSATDSAYAGPAINTMFSSTAITNAGGKADYPYYWTNTSAIPSANGIYAYAWYVAFGRAEDGKGEDLHGAGAVRFDAKVLSSGGASGEERVLNYVRLVRKY
jgi:hypothetical protein